MSVASPRGILWVFGQRLTGGFSVGCLLGSSHLEGFPLGVRRMSVGCVLGSMYLEAFPCNVRWMSVRLRVPGGIAVWVSVQ